MGAEIAARDHGGGVRPPGGAGRARDRLGRAVSARRRSSSTTCPSVERIADGGPTDGEVLMAERVFVMPDLGEGLEEGEIVAWLVAEGDDGRAEPAARRGRDREGGRRDPVAVRGARRDAARRGRRRVPVGAPLVTFDVAATSVAPDGRVDATPPVRKLGEEPRPRPPSGSSPRTAGSTSRRSPAPDPAGGSRVEDAERGRWTRCAVRRRRRSPDHAGAPGDRATADARPRPSRR